MASIPAQPARSSQGSSFGWVEVAAFVAFGFLIWAATRAHVLSPRFLTALAAASLGTLAALLLFRVFRWLVHLVTPPMPGGESSQ